MIDTDKTYSILIRSQLPREMLGYIWAMCNKENPGVLAKHELFLVLAMVAIAQVGKYGLTSQCDVLVGQHRRC